MIAVRLRRLPVRAWRRAVTTLFSNAVILAYHRVAEPQDDPQLLCVAAERFAGQLEVLSALGVVVSLRDLVRLAAIGRVPSRAIAVTFDDGYADNLTVAEPLLRTANVPATVFVATGGVEQGEHFWWDVLEDLVLRSSSLPSSLSVTAPDGGHEYPVEPEAGGSRAAGGWDITQSTDPTLRHAAYRALYSICRWLPPDNRRRMLAELAGQVCEPAPGADHRRLTPAEIGLLAAGGLVEVGAHGVSHAPLGSLRVDAQRDELWQSKQQVAAWSGRPVDLLSYPLGAPGDVTRLTRQLARDCGYMAACANHRGVVWKRSDPFSLPRFLVRDWEPAGFAERLEAWLSGGT